MSAKKETKKIIVIGPAYPFRGGLAAFNERLARELQQMGHEVIIYTFSLQYPKFLFPGKSQYADTPPPKDLKIHIKINSINPFNWWKTGWQIRKEHPDLVICRYWLPLMAPCFGTLLRLIKRRSTTITGLLDNVTPHEKRPGDRPLTRYFLSACDRFVVMSKSVVEDLRKFDLKKPVQLIPHPLYDHFGEKISKSEARQKLELPENEKILLFFGFIRRYKGLDILLKAMSDKRIRQAHIKLLIAGEFYEDKNFYENIIEENNLKEQLILHTDFIPDAEVKYYFCATDLVVQPYRSATQSGITPLAYHFEKPMIVTDVGGLPEMVPDEKVGLVSNADPQSVADAILKFYSVGESHFIPFIQKEKQKYSWERMAQALLNIV